MRDDKSAMDLLNISDQHQPFPNFLLHGIVNLFQRGELFAGEWVWQKLTPLRRPYVVGVPLLRSWETAVTSCAGANGLVRRMLFGTPCEAYWSALAPVR
jgi:hypothetical protein